MLTICYCDRSYQCTANIQYISLPPSCNARFSIASCQSQTGDCSYNAPAGPRAILMRTSLDLPVPPIMHHLCKQYCDRKPCQAV